MAPELDYTKANFPAMAQAEADMMTASKALRGELDDLNGDLHKVLHEAWDGDAHNAYTIYRDEWNVAASKIQGIVHRLGQAIGNIHGNYAAAERANAKLWEESAGLPKH